MKTFQHIFLRIKIITGPPTNSVGTRLVTLSGVSSSFVVVCNTPRPYGGPARGFTRAGQAMTSCRLQSNDSFTVTLQGGPVVLRPVRATSPCYIWGNVHDAEKWREMSFTQLIRALFSHLPPLLTVSLLVLK